MFKLLENILVFVSAVFEIISIIQELSKEIHKIENDVVVQLIQVKVLDFFPEHFLVVPNIILFLAIIHPRAVFSY